MSLPRGHVGWLTWLASHCWCQGPCTHNPWTFVANYASLQPIPSPFTKEAKRLGLAMSCTTLDKGKYKKRSTCRPSSMKQTHGIYHAFWNFGMRMTYGCWCSRHFKSFKMVGCLWHHVQWTVWVLPKTINSYAWVQRVKYMSTLDIYLWYILDRVHINAACWEDNGRMTQNINVYARVQHAKTTWLKIMCSILLGWKYPHAFKEQIMCSIWCASSFNSMSTGFKPKRATCGDLPTNLMTTHPPTYLSTYLHTHP